MTHRIRHHLPLVGYLILVIAVLIAIVQVQDVSKNDIARAQRASIVQCERSNNLRQQINTQNRSFLLSNRTTYILFQHVAARTREPGRANPLADEIDAAADQYRRIEHNYRPIPLVNCVQAFKAK